MSNVCKILWLTILAPSWNWTDYLISTVMVRVGLILLKPPTRLEFTIVPDSAEPMFPMTKLC